MMWLRSIAQKLKRRLIAIIKKLKILAMLGREVFLNNSVPVRVQAGEAHLGVVLIDERLSLNGKIWHNYLHDIEKYLLFSTTIVSPIEYENLIARITAHYHVIEKGMALQETRLGYGQDIIRSLLLLLNQYVQSQYPARDNQFVSAIKTLEAYCCFHELNHFDVSQLRQELKHFEHFSETNDCAGGVITLSKTDILEQKQGDFKDLAYSRYSIREFSQEQVDVNLILEAIEIAQKTPSVCNRQASRVYVIADREVKNRVLAHQNGNRGFGHLADKVLIVTSDLRAFYGIQERNQAFIDGGMFGMSLIYALHSLGLATCTLNWAVTVDKDIDLRNEISLNEREVVIFMIAVGHFPENFKVAVSQRKNIEEVIRIV